MHQCTVLSFFHAFNLSVAALLSYFEIVYVQPVTIFGLTLVRTSLTKITKIFCLAGYLNDCDVP